MIVFPNAKVNFGLRVIRRRADGFHDIETGFYPLPLRDALEILPSDVFRFTQTGIPLDVSGNNLCVRAFQVLKTIFPQMPPVQIHLHKSIPAGAGLGGGSADAAFTLQLLNKMFQLDISNDRLRTIALQLGSDCPFFIENKPAIGHGRGELLTPLQLTLPHYQILIINPGIHISTAWAFSQVQPRVPDAELASLLQQPPENWRNTVCNDFEKPVFEKFPVIAGLKEWLYQQGAVYAALSGSGSTVFGLFNTSLPDTRLLPAHYHFFSTNLEQ